VWCHGVLARLGAAASQCVLQLRSLRLGVPCGDEAWLASPRMPVQVISIDVSTEAATTVIRAANSLRLLSLTLYDAPLSACELLRTALSTLTYLAFDGCRVRGGSCRSCRFCGWG